MKRTLLFSVLLLAFAATASAGTITSISPSSIKVNSGEHFVQINGSGLGSVIVFDGPAGHFELNANATFSGSVHFWVPSEIIRTAGTYSVFVRGGTGDSNSVNFTVQGFKFFPFVIIIPDILRYQPQGREGAYVKYDVITAGGEVYDPNPRVDCFPMSGDFFKMGNTRVDCTAYNSAGEKATSTFTVSVMDTVGPVITVPRELIKVPAESREGATVKYDVSAYDEIWGQATPDCKPGNGDLFPIGLTVVTCYATDLEGNIGTAHFPVEVVGDSNFYKLELRAQDVVVDARSPEGEYVDYKVEVSGTKDESPDVSCYPKAGTLFPLGTTLVDCEAIDYNGMRGATTFSVEVRDPSAPVIDKIYATPDLLKSDGNLYPIEIVVSASDDFDPRPVCQIYAVTSNQTINLDDDDDPKSYDWNITGDLTLELRAENVRTDRYYDVWVGCTDYYGNRTNASARVVSSSFLFGAPQEVSGGKKRRGPKD